MARRQYKPGDLTFGQALLFGLGTAGAFFGAAMALHFAGDVYQYGKRWLLKRPGEIETPPVNGGALSGLYGYRR